MSPAPSDRVTIVSGLPRSGTSMMMQLLTAGGLEPLTDQIRTPDGSNPKGYFEYELVKSLAQDQSWLPLARGKVVKVIVQLLQFLPTGLPCQVVLMQRDIDEVLESQATMLGKQLPASQAQTLKATFQRHWEQSRSRLESSPECSLLVVEHRNLMTRTETEITRLIEFFTPQQLKREEMRRVVDPTLYRSRTSGELP
ncbi:MAG: sulfotransferase family protein [Planctomycetota bacterium]